MEKKWHWWVAALVAMVYIALVECVAHADFDPQPEDFVDGCSLERVPNCKYEVKFGSRDAITNVEAPMWPGDATYRFVSAPQKLLIASTSIDDDIAGSGARRVLIIGQANLEWIEEAIDLGGTTPVETVNSFDFVHRMYVIHSGLASPVNPAVEGSTGAAGNITATTQSSDDLLAFIAQGANITQQAILRVPNREQWIIHRVAATAGQNKEVIIRYYIRWPGTSIFQSRGQLNVVEGSPVIDGHRLLPPGTDVIVTGRTVVGMANASITIQLLRFGTSEIPIVIPRSVPSNQTTD